MTPKELIALTDQYNNIKLPDSVDTISTVRKIFDSTQDKESTAWFASNIAADFVLQKHWWGKSEHWDIRIRKKNARSWFGFALKDNPIGSKKGEHIAIWPKGSKDEYAEISNMYWFNVIDSTIPPGNPGNPVINYDAHIKQVDTGPCDIVRREKEFIEVVFYGKELSGKYFFRQIKDKDSTFWNAWRAKDQNMAVSSITGYVRASVHQDYNVQIDALLRLQAQLKEVRQ